MMITVAEPEIFLTSFTASSNKWTKKIQWGQTNPRFTCMDKCSAVAEMGDLLATIDMGQKVGVLCPF